ncbi:MAG: hypothetical protein WCJ37_19350 [Syntrophus sp. (in: bacteria)]
MKSVEGKMMDFVEIEVHDEECVKKGYKPFGPRKLVINFTDEKSANETIDGLKKQILEWYFKQSLQRIKAE